jgi:hypothetical protein
MLTPENREIRQQEKMMAAMFPLRFHSAISALVVLVAEAAEVVVEELVAVVVELLEVVEVDEVVDCVEVEEVELVLVVVVEVDDIVVELEVEVVEVVEVSEEVVLVDVSELVFADVVVVDSEDSEAVDVSRATMITRSVSSRALRRFRPPSVSRDGVSFITMAFSDSGEDDEGLYGWHAINVKCDASSRRAVPWSLFMLSTSYQDRGRNQSKFYL